MNLAVEVLTSLFDGSPTKRSNRYVTQNELRKRRIFNYLTEPVPDTDCEQFVIDAFQSESSFLQLLQYVIDFELFSNLRLRGETLYAEVVKFVDNTPAINFIAGPDLHHLSIRFYTAEARGGFAYDSFRSVAWLAKCTHCSLLRNVFCKEREGDFPSLLGFSRPNTESILHVARVWTWCIADLLGDAWEVLVPESLTDADTRFEWYITLLLYASICTIRYDKSAMRYSSSISSSTKTRRDTDSMYCASMPALRELKQSCEEYVLFDSVRLTFDEILNQRSKKGAAPVLVSRFARLYKKYARIKPNLTDDDRRACSVAVDEETDGYVKRFLATYQM